MANNNKQKTKPKSSKEIKSSQVDFGNDPYFVKKTKEAKEFMDKHPIPKELLTRK